MRHVAVPQSHTLARALTAREEMRYLAGELKSAAERAGVPTPSFDRITSWLNESKEPLIDGSMEVGLDYRALLLLLVFR